MGTCPKHFGQKNRQMIEKQSTWLLFLYLSFAFDIMEYKKVTYELRR